MDIPPQVELQKPALLLDACDRRAPFHLEFISSADAFLAVLKIRFRQAGVRARGLRKLDDLEFVLHSQDKALNVALPWERVFRPGQIVDMRMTFRRTVPPSTCPSCNTESEGGTDDELEW